MSKQSPDLAYIPALLAGFLWLFSAIVSAQDKGLSLGKLELLSKPGEPFDARVALGVTDANASGLVFPQVLGQHHYFARGLSLPRHPLQDFQVDVVRGADERDWLNIRTTQALDADEFTLIVRIRVDALESIHEIFVSWPGQAHSGVSSQQLAIGLLAFLSLGLVALRVRRKSQLAFTVDDLSPQGFAPNDAVYRRPARRASAQTKPVNGRHPASVVKARGVDKSQETSAANAQCSEDAEAVDEKLAAEQIVSTSGAQYEPSFDDNEWAFETMELSDEVLAQTLSEFSEAAEEVASDEMSEPQGLIVEPSSQTQGGSEGVTDFTLDSQSDWPAVAELYEHADDYQQRLQVLASRAGLDSDSATGIRRKNTEWQSIADVLASAEKYQPLFAEKFELKTKKTEQGRLTLQSRNLERGGIDDAKPQLPVLSVEAQYRLAQALVLIKASGDAQLANWLLMELSAQDDSQGGGHSIKQAGGNRCQVHME